MGDHPTAGVNVGGGILSRLPSDHPRLTLGSCLPRLGRARSIGPFAVGPAFLVRPPVPFVECVLAARLPPTVTAVPAATSRTIAMPAAAPEQQPDEPEDQEEEQQEAEEAEEPEAEPERVPAVIA